MDGKVFFLDLLDLAFPLEIDRQFLSLEIPLRERVVSDVLLGKSYPLSCDRNDAVLSPRIFCNLADEADTRDERIFLLPNPGFGVGIFFRACIEGDESFVNHRNRSEVASFPKVFSEDSIRALSCSLIPW